MVDKRAVPVDIDTRLSCVYFPLVEVDLLSCSLVLSSFRLTEQTFNASQSRVEQAPCTVCGIKKFSIGVAIIVLEHIFFRSLPYSIMLLILYHQRKVAASLTLFHDVWELDAVLGCT
jgi:hypothetical protein